MIRIQQLKLSITHTEEQLKKKMAKMLRISPEDILRYQIRKQSVDARKKQEVSFVYTVDVAVEKEAAVLRRVKSSQVSLAKEVPYQFPEEGAIRLWLSEVAQRVCFVPIYWRSMAIARSYWNGGSLWKSARGMLSGSGRTMRWT